MTPQQRKRVSLIFRLVLDLVAIVLKMFVSGYLIYYAFNAMAGAGSFRDAGLEPFIALALSLLLAPETLPEAGEKEP